MGKILIIVGLSLLFLMNIAFFFRESWEPAAFAVDYFLAPGLVITLTGAVRMIWKGD
jgi:hypothetical protein